MKKCILFLICCFSFPGCMLLELPGMILGELVPLAIQYAPYALMFIEETDERDIAEKQNEISKGKLKDFIQKPVAEMDELHVAYQDFIAKNKNIQSVYVINLKNSNEKQLVEFYEKISSQGKIHCCFVKLNINNQEHLSQMKIHSSIPIRTANLEVKEHNK